MHKGKNLYSEQAVSYTHLDVYKRQDMTREEAEEVAIELSVEIAAKLYDIADGFYFMTPFNLSLIHI